MNTKKQDKEKKKIEEQNNEKKDIFNEIKSSFMKHYLISKDSADKFSQELWQNPKQSLDNLLKIYDESLDKAYTNSKTGENTRSFIEAAAGGPHEAIPSALYNSIGTIYPFFDRNLRDYALGKILNIMDKINNRYIQIAHTPYIREPLLLTDICISRQLYWPGLEGEEGERLIKKYNPLFCDFKTELINEEGFFNKNKIKSDFLVAYSLLRKDFCNWGEEYAEIANERFLDRVLQGITAMRFADYFKLKSLSQEEIEGINYEAKDSNFYSKNKLKLDNSLDRNISLGRNRLMELLPQSLHGKIEEKIEQKDWADSFLFQRHKNYLLKSWVDYFTKE